MFPQGEQGHRLYQICDDSKRLQAVPPEGYSGIQIRLRAQDRMRTVQFQIQGYRSGTAVGTQQAFCRKPEYHCPYFSAGHCCRRFCHSSPKTCKKPKAGFPLRLISSLSRYPIFYFRHSLFYGRCLIAVPLLTYPTSPLLLGRSFCSCLR